jgi:serine/threonine-protein kinase
MGITAGTRVGPYEIVSPLGAGGMGEVFRARDTRLGRDVAVKVVPSLFADDPDRTARFAREAHVLASLNHPNIASIYGFEESGGVQALVLELVDGPTLADRLAVGPIAQDEVVAIARQIVDALEAAHEQGIVHRDLKPANIKLRPDGTVKVLDFGLAKALDPTSSSNADVMNSPTLTARATQLGIILGTAAYMAPEQARGKPVDKRADIWAFGCVLYEMLTGRRAFDGEDISDTLAFVITRDPNWSALPHTTSASLRKLLGRCLEKDRRRRLADIADARFDIEEAAAPRDTVSDAVAEDRRQAGGRVVLPWLAAALFAAMLAVAVGLWAPWRSEPPHAPLRLSTEIGSVGELQPGIGLAPALALSRDGTTLAFTASASRARRQSLLYVRRLDEFSAAPLAGTEGASSPFFSPDGQSLAFFADGRLKRIPVRGGPVVTLADAPDPRGGSWALDHTIVFTPERGGAIVLRLGAARIDSTPLSGSERTEREDLIQRWAQLLPDGKNVLYTSHSRAGDFENANLAIRPLSGGARKVVLRGAYHGRYVGSGHLLFVREGTLFAIPFDLARLETTGTPVPIVERLIATTLSGAAQFAVSESGTLAYAQGDEAATGTVISWMRADGKLSPLRPMNAIWESLAISPDGSRFAVDMHDGKQWDLYLYEWARDNFSRLTLTGGSRPVWTVTGRKIVYSAALERGAESLRWLNYDGTGQPEQLTTSTNPQRAASWHPSGRFLAFVELTPKTSWDVLILPMNGSESTGWKAGTPTAFLDTPAAEAEPMFSPDGHWIAYQSNESGRNEVYVRPFPGPGPRTPISRDGGTQPIWSPTRNELFYCAPDGELMVIPYSKSNAGFNAGVPRVWARGDFLVRQGPRLSRSIDVHPDGERFAVAALPDGDTRDKRDHVRLIFNFFDELRRIAPATKQ